MIRDEFITNSDYLDKQHLDQFALTASQLKRRIDQSKENLKIVKRGPSAEAQVRCTKQQLSTTRDRQRAKTLLDLFEGNARWNEERRDAAKNDIRWIVNAAGQFNPDLRKKWSIPAKGDSLKTRKRRTRLHQRKRFFGKIL